MSEYLELFVRSLVSGMGSGVGTYLVLKLMMNKLEAVIKKPNDKKPH